VWVGRGYGSRSGRRGVTVLRGGPGGEAVGRGWVGARVWDTHVVAGQRMVDDVQAATTHIKGCFLTCGVRSGLHVRCV
jgi:hypothetical protein